MKRREFITLIGGMAGAWPLAASAEQAALPVIGFLNSASPRPFSNMVEAFDEGLHSQGLRAGRDYRVHYEWAEGQYDKLPALATELVRRDVAIIAATGGVSSAQAAIKATSSIPIVFVIGIDPVQIGMVSSLNRPGGNATGVSLYTTELAAKRLELLKELVPGSSTFALLVNPEAETIEIETQDMSAGARAIGLELLIFKARTGPEIGGGHLPPPRDSRRARSLLVPILFSRASAAKSWRLQPVIHCLRFMRSADTHKLAA